MRRIDRRLLDDASAAARAAPRGRKNVNFHASDEDRSHRLLNAIEPGSYVAPHRHADPAKDETIVVLRGRLGVVTFDEAGQVTDTVALGPDGDVVGLTVPADTFHSLVSLAQGTVFFESKAGPYRPLSPQERAAWAPAEQTPEGASYLAALARRFEARAE